MYARNQSYFISTGSNWLHYSYGLSTVIWVSHLWCIYQHACRLEKEQSKTGRLNPKLCQLCQLYNASLIFLTGGSRNAQVQLCQLSCQSCNWQLPVSKLPTGQSLLYFPPETSETASFTNFANSVAKVATGNSQFLNCQLGNQPSNFLPGPQKLQTSPTSPTSSTQLPRLQLANPSF
jgi:hypothetical protein